MKNSLFLLLCLCSSFKILAQGEIGVDLFTGTPSLELPIVTITSHDLSDQVSLVYNAKGLKIDEPTGRFGAGWGLRNTFGIRRAVRGLPDDYFALTVYDQRRGWLYQTNASTGVNTAVTKIPNSADNSPGTCSDETADYQALKDYDEGNEGLAKSIVYDKEPDFFYYEIPGYAGAFVFDNSPDQKIRLIPYQDIQIEPVFGTAPANKEIRKFRITTNAGIIYEFNAGSKESRSILSYTLHPPEFFTSEFHAYNISKFKVPATYTTSWDLGKTSSPTGDYLSYNYAYEEFNHTDTVRVSVRKELGVSEYVMQKVYADHRKGVRTVLASVSASAGMSVSFSPDANGLVTSFKISDMRKGSFSEGVKEFKLAYIGAPEQEFLRSVQEYAGSTTYPAYEFDYGAMSQPLPGSPSQDFWGYWNGRHNKTLAPRMYVYPQLAPEHRYRLYPIPGYSGEMHVLEGADRTVNPETIQIGALKSVKFPWGGVTTVVYEANTYWDEIANQEQYGGGLRIKSFTYMDGLNPDAKITKYFTYTDASGRTSGRIIREPVFVIPTWGYRNKFTGGPISYSQLLENPATLWSALTVRAEHDLAYSELTHGSEVGYNEVKVFRPGSGYAHFEYTLPATHGAAAVGEWIPAINKFARSPVDCPPMGVISMAARNIFPYLPDPGYDYERGLVWRKREYDAKNTLVRKTETAYQYMYKSGTAPVKVWGLKREKYPNRDEAIYLFGKYFLLTDVSKVIASETVTTFDAADPVKWNADVTQYFYESAAHKLLSRISHTQPDGTVYTTRMKYPLDYGTIPSGSDTTSQMIGQLQTSRNGIPIETYTTIARNGAGEKVISGSITRFNNFEGTQILPKHQLSWSSASPLALESFTPSYIDPSTKTFRPHSGYEKVTTYLAYDNFAKPKSVTSQERTVVNTIWGYNTSVPLATITGANPDQIAFSDFEWNTGSPIAFGLTSLINDGPKGPEFFYAQGHTGSRGITPSITMCTFLNKGAPVYRLSGWWNKADTAFKVRVIIRRRIEPSTTVYYDQTFSLHSLAGDGFEWEYFSREIPIDAELQDFAVEIKFSEGFAAPLRVDDIGFAPVNATLSTFTYQFPYGMSSSFTGNIGNIVEFDALGRLKYVMDAQRNIRQHTKFEFTKND